MSAADTMHPRLVRVGAAVTSAAFSGAEPPPEERAEIEAILDEAETASPPPRVWARLRPNR